MKTTWIRVISVITTLVIGLMFAAEGVPMVAIMYAYCLLLFREIWTREDLITHAEQQLSIAVSFLEEERHAQK